MIRGSLKINIFNSQCYDRRRRGNTSYKLPGETETNRSRVAKFDALYWIASHAFNIKGFIISF